jgi:4-methyl-5(b-hydroxyethyl)-thiazole monophosphate biosynthesis
MKLFIPLADGFEDIEAFTVVDVLRRAGIKIDTVGVVGSVITSGSNIRLFADKKISDINANEYDGIILPGGSKGVENLSRSGKLLEMLTQLNDKGKLIAAICAAPSLLAKAGILEKKKATIYPGMENQIPYPRGGRIVVDGNVVTSQAPGTAMEFALAIVSRLLGREKAYQLEKDLVV